MASAAHVTLEASTSCTAWRRIFAPRRAARGLLMGRAARGLLIVWVLIAAGCLVSTAVWAQDSLAVDPPAQQVESIQNMLKRLGYDPGPADGVPGSRTVGAIISFQRDTGLSQTGQPDQTVYNALVRRLAASAKPAAAPPATAAAAASHPAHRAKATLAAARPVATMVSAQSIPVPGTPPPTASTPTASTPTASTSAAQTPPAASRRLAVAGRWLVVDSTGGQETLQLDPKGTITNVSTPEFWKWRLEDGGKLLIEYDNDMGGWVRRTGHIESRNRIAGTAKSSLGNHWSWTADRIDAPN